MAEDFNKFPQVSDALQEAIKQVIKKTAFDLQASAQSMAPVDTGFLRNSIYTVTTDESTYDQAGSPPGDASLLPEVEPPEDEFTAYVAVGASYGVYQEFGTRFQSGQPYFYPAIDAVKPEFDEAMNAIKAKIEGV